MQVSNNCNFIGRLTRDPELRFIPNSGKAVANVTIAIEDEFDRQNSDKTLFMDGVIFGKAAEVIANHCKKGKLFAMGGKLQPEKWEDKNTGQQRMKLKLFIEGFKILEWANDNSQGQQQPRQQPQQQSYTQNNQQGVNNFNQQPQQQQQQPQNNFNGFQAIEGDDDIPF